MLAKDMNEFVTRSGPGTPMGELMRRYWMPALLSNELPESDCPPARVKLLGENLIAFRDSHGQVGLLDEFCAHRRASLFLGRNEEGGLRCIYHGWKYDREGRCVEMPNEPPETRFIDKIHLKAYPTVELAGIIWAYMGPKDKMPPPPAFEWTQVSEGYRCVSKVWQECNWLQALEGGIDSTHGGFLHRTVSSYTKRVGINVDDFRVKLAAPKHEVDITDYGFLYASTRSLDEKRTFVRTYHYAIPTYQFWAVISDKPEAAGNMWVPMDDENCMVYSMMYRYAGDPFTDEERLWFDTHSGRGPGDLTPDFRKVRNKDNNWMIDRQVQRIETFSGIEGINLQDHAIQESMGPIVDRTQEHLGAADIAIITARRLLIQAAKTVQAGGEPPRVRPNNLRFRAVHKMIENGAGWRVALRDEIYPPPTSTGEAVT